MMMMTMYHQLFFATPFPFLEKRPGRYVEEAEEGPEGGDRAAQGPNGDLVLVFCPVVLLYLCTTT